MRLTTADRNHDLQAVTVLQYTGVKLTARHDFAIAFHGNAFTGQLEFADQIGAARCVVEGAGFAVDNDGNQNRGLIGVYKGMLSLTLETHFTALCRFFRPVHGRMATR